MLSYRCAIQLNGGVFQWARDVNLICVWLNSTKGISHYFTPALKIKLRIAIFSNQLSSITNQLPLPLYNVTSAYPAVLPILKCQVANAITSSLHTGKMLTHIHHGYREGPDEHTSLRLRCHLPKGLLLSQWNILSLTSKLDQLRQILASNGKDHPSATYWTTISTYKESTSCERTGPSKNILELCIFMKLSFSSPVMI